MHNAVDIAKFVRTELRAALPAFTMQYKRRDILRARGNLLQWLFVGVKRSGSIRVSPTLYVLGAEIYLRDLDRHQLPDGVPDTDALFNSAVGLTGKFPRRWSFDQETLLNANFANDILNRLNHDSPISFTEPLADETIDQSLRWFGKDGLSWAAGLLLAFFNMTRGAPTARKDLAGAFQIFLKRSRYATDKPPLDFEQALHARFKELEARLDQPDCIALCRADAQAHAQLLKLPPIVWPPEWPESVPPWPKETSTGLTAKLSRFFGR